MTLFKLSFMGAVMILVICALRAAVLNKLPRRSFVLLWLLAAARLVLPWQVTSPISVYRLFEIPEASGAAPAGHIVSMNTTASTVLESETFDVAQELPAAAASVPADLWTTLWWTGFIACAAITAAVYAAWLRRFSQSLPADMPAVQAFIRQHPLRRRLAVRCSSYIRAPLTYGVIRPVILLPASLDLTNKEELNYILTHEYVHVRHFDALLKLVLAAVCCVHWFNPLVWAMYVLASRDMELACDECVVARCGGRADYARMLIGLEAKKLGYIVPGMSSSAGAAKERIRSIMKLKKKSVLTVIVAGALIAGVGTAFATSAPEAQPDGAWSEVAVHDAFAMEDTAGGASSIEAEDGIEWWTAQEYAAWLENEKEDLQSILGSKSWTPSEGEFVWTQDRIDEAIARYEQILADIRRGVKVSKSVDGDDSITIMQSTASEDSSDYIDPERFKAYAGFGLTMEADGPVFEGEKVRYFEDAVEIEPGMIASKTTYLSDEGTAMIRTVRRPTQNADGSTDPFGQLIGIERIPEEEAEAILKSFTEEDVVAASAEDVTITSEDSISFADLAPYKDFGLEFEPVSDGFLMRYDGKVVHSLYDPVTGTWFASSMHGYNLGPDRVDLEAVYTDGRLSGLKATPEQHNAETAQEAYVMEEAAEQGRTFEEVFQSYEALGLTSRRITASSGGIGYNLFLNGRPVNHFADISPSGSAFSFESAEQVPGGLSVHVVYDESVPVRIQND